MPRQRDFIDYEPVVRSSASSSARLRGGKSGRMVGTTRNALEDEWAQTPPSVQRANHDVSGRGENSLDQKGAISVAKKVGIKGDGWVVKRGHLISYLGLFLFTFVLFFRPYELFSSLSFLNKSALVVAIFTLIVFFPTQLAVEGNLTARPREVNLVLLLCVTGLLSIPLAISRTEAWGTFSDVFIKAVLMFIVMINVVRTERRLKGIIFISLAAGVVASVSALNAYRSGNFTVEGYRVTGVIGNLLANPNDMALHLDTMLPITVGLMLGERNAFKKIIYGTFALLIIGGIVVTFSRGGFLGLLAVVGVMAWKLGRRNRMGVMTVTIFAALVFIALAPGNYGIRLLSIFDHSLDPVGSAGSRQDLLTLGIQQAIRHPLFGIGMGNFHIISIKELVSHNAYIQVASEMGFTALVIYVWFMLTPLKRLRQIERETFNERVATKYYYLAVGLQTSIVAYLLTSFFASVAYQWYIYYIVGYCICWRRIYETDPRMSEVRASNSAAQEEVARTAKGNKIISGRRTLDEPATMGGRF